MSKSHRFLKDKLGQVSAKTLVLGGKQFVKSRNEYKIKYAEAFTYTSLSSARHIRLLKINPGEETDVISSELFEVDLDSNPRYEAISYTWGLSAEWSTSEFDLVEDTEHEERPILLNARTHHVTMNLYNALTELRRRKWNEPIWIDQICINQQNNEEKVSQVKLMADVYSSASTVIIWMGKTSMMRNSALDYVEKLPDQPPHPERAASHPLASTTLNEKDTRRPALKKSSHSFNALLQIGSSLSSHYHWICVTFMFSLPWFARAWTLQELLLSANFRILMGDRDIQPGWIARAARQLVDFYTVDPLAIRFGVNVAFLGIREILQDRAALFDERKEFLQGKRYSAQEYLAMIRLRAASVPKDKVFAGTALLEGGALKSVDYSCTTLEVYLAFATERLWPQTNIFALSLVGGTEPDTEGLPTWVPDLNSRLRPEPLQQCGSPTLETPIQEDYATFDIEGKKLQINVAVWDVVKATGESIWSWTRYDDEPYNSDLTMRTTGSATEERFGLMFSLLTDLGVSYMPTGERTIDAFWQTLIGGSNASSSEPIEEWRDRFRYWFAFTLVQIRYHFWLEREHSGNRLVTLSPHKKWMVSLIADKPALEERVAKFLDFHDQELVQMHELEQTPQLLRRIIERVAKRLWGVDNIEQLNAWKCEVAEWNNILISEGFYDPISKFAEHFESAYAGRRLFTTTKGYLGIGTEGMRAGDVICYVAGATVPFMLRPVANKEGTFTLVGEAYVHGAIQGGKSVIWDLKFKSVRII